MCVFTSSPSDSETGIEYQDGDIQQPQDCALAQSVLVCILEEEDHCVAVRTRVLAYIGRHCVRHIKGSTCLSIFRLWFCSLTSTYSTGNNTHNTLLASASSTVFKSSPAVSRAATSTSDSVTFLTCSKLVAGFRVRGEPSFSGSVRDDVDDILKAEKQ